MMNKQKPLIRVQKAVLLGCNAYLKANEKDGRGTRLVVGFSRGDTASELNGLITRIGLRGMMEGKDCRTLDRVFLSCQVYRSCK